jgi:2-methylcitrate dehydratase PrpD
MSVLEILADWTVNRSSEWPEVVALRAEHAIADTVACIIAGGADPVSLKVVAGVASWGVGLATVAGTSRKVPAPWAAMVNGTAAHVLEIDDNYYPAFDACFRDSGACADRTGGRGECQWC